jgi:hypothetical protein
MAKFKIGDKAWYFDAEWDGHIVMDDISIRSVELTTKEMVEAYSQAPLYHKSKRAALNSMAKRLKEFVGNGEVDEE